MREPQQAPAVRRSAALRAAVRLGLRIAYPTLRAYWFVARSKIHGVQCVIVRNDEIVLVRHTYGDRRRWELPGGAIKRGEEALDAARREVREELGVEIDDWRELGEVEVNIDWRSGSLACFVHDVEAFEPHIDEVEIGELRWFHRDELPRRRGEHVAQIVAMTARERA